MESDNPSGADNQQETASPCSVLDPNWVVGFVDGEGCFSVSAHHRRAMNRHAEATFAIHESHDPMGVEHGA